MTFVDSPQADAAPIELFNVSVFEAHRSHDDILRAIHSSLHDEDGMEIAPYVVESRRTHLSWGAEHIVGEIVFWIGTTMLGGLAYDGVKKVIRELAAAAEGPDPTVDRDEAVGLARGLIAGRYGIDDELLELLAEESSSSGGLVLLFRTAEHEFEAEVAGQCGYATVVRVRREVSPG